MTPSRCRCWAGFVVTGDRCGACRLVRHRDRHAPGRLRWTWPDDFNLYRGLYIGLDAPPKGDLLERDQWQDEEAWRELAACRGSTDLFFDTGTIDTAVTICNACPVKDDCLAVALADHTLVGVWGGTTDQERRTLRKEAA